MLDFDSLGLAGMPPGPELAAGLAAAKPADGDPYELIEVMKAARRLSSWAQSVELAAVASLSRFRHVQAAQRVTHRPWDSEVHKAVVDEVSVALTLTTSTASMEVAFAEDLSGRLRDTLSMLAEGLIDFPRALALFDGLSGVDDAIAARVEARVLPFAPRLTTGRLRAKIRKEIIAADPAAYERRREETARARRVELYDNPTGTCDLTGRDLPANAATAAYNRINAIAAALKTDGDERPIDAIRADVLMDLLRGDRPGRHLVTGAEAAGVAAGHGMRLPARGRAFGAGLGAGPDRAAGATGSADTESGPDSKSASDELAVASALSEAVRRRLEELFGAGFDSARLGGHAPLVAEAVRRMAEVVQDLKTRWCTYGTDPAGDGVHGHLGYRPPAGMRRRIEQRDATCRYPSCRRPARRCDADHTRPHHLGGPTCPCNLAALCRRHHRLKASTGWTLLQPWPGVLVWVTPTGHFHVQGPDP